MFEPFANVPAYLLIFPVSWGATAFFALAMACRLRTGLMHAGIFWGFVLLTIGTANTVTDGLIEAVLSAPLDRAVRAAACQRRGT